MNDDIKVTMTEWPDEGVWAEVKRRALVTIWKKMKNPPNEEWKKAILKSRHSPIRRIRFSFDIECPYWVSVHLSRHIHAQPYVSSQRDDRQDMYKRGKAPQDAIVMLIWDMNGEELLNVMNKRLCNLASQETREVVIKMKHEVLEKCPEFADEMVPNCVRNHACYEMFPCNKPLKTTLESLED